MSADQSAGRPLKLLAVAPEDLEILSAHLQDALVPICDIAYLGDERLFVMVVNRFKWENGAVVPGPAAPAAGVASGQAGMNPGGMNPGGMNDVPKPVYMRTNCGVRFTGVRGVRCRGINLRDRGQILELLAMQVTEGAVVLQFAGGGCLWLDTDALNCLMEDIGEPWPTLSRPEHRLDTGEAPPRAHGTG
jgi:hypothetical protein